MSRELDSLDRPIPPAYMAHFVLRTRDLQKLKAWYEKVLGARAVFENPIAAFMTFDSEHHRLAIIQNSDFKPAEEQSVGVDHVAYTFSSLDDLLHTYKRLSADRIAERLGMPLVRHSDTLAALGPATFGGAVLTTAEASAGKVLARASSRPRIRVGLRRRLGHGRERARPRELLPPLPAVRHRSGGVRA